MNLLYAELNLPNGADILMDEDEWDNEEDSYSILLTDIPHQLNKKEFKKIINQLERIKI